MAAEIACACNEVVCANLLIRGDKVSFVSAEQAKRTGIHKLDEGKMPSDIKLKRDFVIVHDTEATLFNKCDFHIVKWKSGRQPNDEGMTEEELKAAQGYFGEEARLKTGKVEVPAGPWKKVTKVRVIRYTRYGVKAVSADNFEFDPKGHVDFEHIFSEAVSLEVCRSPLAWKLPLPSGCSVTPHGFVVP